MYIKLYTENSDQVYLAYLQAMIKTFFFVFGAIAGCGLETLLFNSKRVI